MINSVRELKIVLLVKQMRLYVSSSVKTTAAGIVKALVDNGVPSQVTENASVHNGQVESGFTILLFEEVTEKNFQKKVWSVLQPMLNLTCAFVDSEYFRGCVRDWPGVFRVPACPSRLAKEYAEEEI